MKKLIIVRGAPGSGKSTFAKRFNAPVAEADNYFLRPDGKYDFNPRLLKEAHEWCLSSVFEWFKLSDKVAVANTFTRVWEMQKYIDKAHNLGVVVEVYRCNGTWKNIHGVPENKVQEMRGRMEDFEGEINV